MAELSITADEVRYRLRVLNNIDVDDDTLNSDAYIPKAKAKVNVILSNNGTDYESLDTDYKRTLAKAAAISICAQTVIASAPLRGSETGPIKIKPVTTKEKAEMWKLLDDEWKENLRLIGMTLVECYVSSSGGSDYMPDGKDLTNIDFTDEDTDTDKFSVWA